MSEPIPVHCPACGRCQQEAESLKGQRMTCRNCKAKLVIDLSEESLTVQVNLST